MGVPLKLSGACAAKYAVSTRAPSQIVAPTPPRPPVSALGCIPPSPRVSAMPNNADEAYGTSAEFGYCHHNTDASQPLACQIHLAHCWVRTTACLKHSTRRQYHCCRAGLAGRVRQTHCWMEGGHACWCIVRVTPGLSSAVRRSAACAWARSGPPSQHCTGCPSSHLHQRMCSGGGVGRALGLCICGGGGGGTGGRWGDTNSNWLAPFQTDT